LETWEPSQHSLVDKGKPRYTRKPRDTGKPRNTGKPRDTGEPRDTGKPRETGEPNKDNTIIEMTEPIQDINKIPIK
jgi:hypothetical protein